MNAYKYTLLACTIGAYFFKDVDLEMCFNSKKFLNECKNLRKNSGLLMVMNRKTNWVMHRKQDYHRWSIHKMKNLGMNTVKRSMFLNREKPGASKKELPHNE